MSDVVLDATVVRFANGEIAGGPPGSPLNRRLAAVQEVVAGLRRLRYNRKLLGEYDKLAKNDRNDVIEALFAILDGGVGAILVKRNSLSRQEHSRAKDSGWPNHDQHLLAAAIGGDRPSIVVTEQIHAACEQSIFRHFKIRIEDVGD
jgi:hypothetical protein